MEYATDTNETPVPVEESPWALECLPSVLDKIRAAVLEDNSDRAPVEAGFGKRRFGKIRVPFFTRESGLSGVLFGKKEECGVSISAFRPLDSGFAFGRTATPEEDWQAFAALVADVPVVGELSGLKPVGWFQAQPGSELKLSRRDLQVFNQFFREPWHVGLLLRPDRAAPTRARFFLREIDGSFCRETGARDIVVPLTLDVPPLRIERGAAAGSTADAATQEGPASARPVIEPGRSRGPRLRHWAPMIRVWPAALMLAAALVLGRWWAQPAQEAPPPVPSKRPLASISATELQKQLDQEAALLRARVAALEKKWKEEETQDARPDEGEDRTKKPARRESSVPVKRVVPPEGSAKRSSAVQSFRSLPLFDNNQKPPQLATPPSVDRTTRTAAPEKPQPSIALSAGKPAATPPAANGPAVVSQQPASIPQVVPPVTQSPAPASPAIPPSANAAPVQPALSTPAVATAAVNKGRLIWTGRLQRNATLVIDGKNASFGSLTGELPGKPLSVSIYPGVLTNQGFVLYASALGQTKTAFEAPERENGWNKTVFTLDRQPGDNIDVVEVPSPKNGWKRLVLRGKNSKISAIFVDWTAAP